MMTNRYNIAKMFCVVLVIEIAAFSRTIYDCFCASDVFTKTQKKRNSDIVNGTCVTSSIRQYRNNLISPGKDLLNVIYPICFLAAVQFSLSKNKIVPQKNQESTPQTLSHLLRSEGDNDVSRSFAEDGLSGEGNAPGANFFSLHALTTLLSWPVLVTVGADSCDASTWL